MKIIKIFAFPAHGVVGRTSGVDFARIIQPMTYLNGYKDEDTEFKVDIFDPKDSANWLEVAKNYDIVYFNYLNDDWGFAAMKVVCGKLGRKLVMDVDDAIWEIKEDNHAYDVYKKGSRSLEVFNIICKEVDYITCTNQYLKHVICDYSGKHPTQVKVFPNYIDFKQYDHRSPFKDTLEIVLLHHGSTTHFIDLQEEEFAKGVDRIMKEYPNVILKTVGAMIPTYKKRWGRRYVNEFGDQDIYKWIKEKFPRFHDEADILVVPLKKSVYTKCKSSIKFLETSSTGIPGVYQRIRQYEEAITDGKDGYLAETANEWYEKIKTLIDNKEKRREVGQEAFKTVCSKWQIQDHIKEYADFFKSMVKN